MENNLEAFIDRIKNRETRPKNEEATKMAIIAPILKYLGWDIHDTAEVDYEYSVGKSRVDLCLRDKDDGKEKVFIEVKGVNEELERHEEQLLNYSFRQGVRIAILTNGIEWWFYLPMYEGNWEERKVFSVDLLKQKKDKIHTVMHSLLYKNNVLSGDAERHAKAMCEDKKKEEKIRSALPKTWRSLIKEADENLIETLNDANEKNCGYRASNEVIREFLINQDKPQQTERNEVRIRRGAAVRRKRSSGNNTSHPRPKSFVFNGERIDVSSWKSILLKICSRLYDEYGNSFVEEVKKLSGSKKPYISYNKEDLRHPRKPENCDFLLKQI